MIKENPLTHSEEYLMKVFWAEGTPLTSAQLTRLTKQVNWAPNYIHKLLTSLQEKAFIEMCGVVREGKHYSRLFKPIVAKEQYITDYLQRQALQPDSYMKIALGLIKKDLPENKSSEDEELIAELESIIRKLEQEESEEQQT